MSSFSTDLTAINLCESISVTASTSIWFKYGSGASIPLIDGDVKINGTNSVGFRNMASLSETSGGWAGGCFTSSANIADLSASKLFCWTLNTTIADTEPRGGGGVAIAISSDAVAANGAFNSANYHLWYVDGSDANIAGGWKVRVIDPAFTKQYTKGTVTLSAIKAISFMLRQQTGLTTTTYINSFVDCIRRGTNISTYQSDAVTPSTFNELYETDQLSAYGFCQNVGGTYLLNGEINVGLATQASETYFEDAGIGAVFDAQPVSLGYNKIKLVANSTGPQRTIFRLGDYDPATGAISNGCTVGGSPEVGSVYGISTKWRDAVINLNNTTIGAAQAFQVVGAGKKPRYVKFWVTKAAAPTGNMVAKIYASSGTTWIEPKSTATVTGADYKPTGTAIATSNTVAATVITTAGTYQEVTFTFPPATTPLLADNTKYAVSLEYTGDATNYVILGTNATTNFTGGNHATLSGATWTASATITGLMCKLYTTNANSTWSLDAADANSIIKLYGSSFKDIYQTTLNANTRAPTVASCSSSASVTLTTSNSFLTDCIVPGMKITGTGVSGDVYVSSVESATSLTMSSVQTISAATLTFTDQSEIRNSSFSGCGTITPAGIPIYNTTFADLKTTAPISATKYLTFSTNSHVNNLTGCIFAGNGGGNSIEFTQTGTTAVNFNGLSFSGGGANGATTADIRNTGASAVINVTVVDGRDTFTMYNAASGTINVYDRVAINTKDGSAANIQNSRTYLYVSSPPASNTESMPTANRALATDANGNVNQDTQHYGYVVSTLSTWSGFYYKIFKYGKQPYISSVNITGAASLDATLLTDTNISAADAATALTGGSGITITRRASGETETLPLVVMKYTGASSQTAFAAGNVVTGATSGAAGTVVEVLDATTTTGTLVINKNVAGNATDYTGTENLQVASVTKAQAAVATFYQKYTWHIMCNSKSLQATYDYLSAYFEQAAADATMIKVFKWSGTSTNQQLLYNGTNGYYTIRNGTEGVWLSNRGGGTLYQAISDSNVAYSPVASVSVQVKVVNADNQNLTGIRVAIYRSSDNLEILNTTTDGSGLASTTYIYTSDVPVIVKVRKSSVGSTRYAPVSTTGTITSGGYNNTITVVVDPVAI